MLFAPAQCTGTEKSIIEFIAPNYYRGSDVMRDIIMDRMLGDQEVLDAELSMIRHDGHIMRVVILHRSSMSLNDLQQLCMIYGAAYSQGCTITIIRSVQDQRFPFEEMADRVLAYYDLDDFKARWKALFGG